MLVLAIASTSMLAFISYRFSGKSLFHPAVVFCSFWSIDLMFLLLAGDFFYPVHAASLLIEILGAFAFCAGSHLASWNRPRPAQQSLAANRLVTLGTWLIVLSIPMYLKWVVNIVADRGVGQTFLMAVRQTTIEIQGSGLAYNLFGLMVSFSTVIALIAFREKDGHRFRCYVAVVSSFVVCFLTATKGAPIFLIVGLLYLHWEKTKRLSAMAVLSTILVFCAVVAAIEFYVHVNGKSISESVVPVARSAALYVSGPIVAFDRIVEHPTIVPTFAPPYDVLKRMSNKFFGTHLEVSQKIPDFLSLGPFGLEGNTYTFYASWFYFGAIEAVLAVGLCGFLSTLIYRRALRGGAVSSILYAVLVPALCLMPYMDYISSIFVDLFAAGSAWLIYQLPNRWKAFRRLCGSFVKGDLTRLEANR